MQVGEMSYFCEQIIVDYMRILVLFLLFIFVMLSGCGNRNNPKISKNDSQFLDDNVDSIENGMDDTDRIYFLDFEQILTKEDTFRINSIAKNITFIPLETSDSALLYSEAFKIEKMNERYLVSSASLSAYHYIMTFDSAGNFIDYLMKRGQGPRELPYITEWYVNQNVQLLVASSSYQIVLHSFENNTFNKYTLGGYYPNISLLNDGTIVGMPTAFGKGDTVTPYLHFINQEGKIVRSLYYSQKRNIDYDFPEGEIKGILERYRLYQSYSGDVLFQEMFNDTIYRISSMDEVDPHIIQYRGSLTPTLKDMNNPITNPQKVFISQILDTKKYFIISYRYRGTVYTAIWDKQTFSLIANTKHGGSFGVNGTTKYRTPTGKEIFIRISNYIDDNLYCVLDAEQAMDFLPNIKEDDNPILMVIDL